MNKPKEVKSDIYWVGALDYDIRVFDIVMTTEYGTTYNSYVVKASEKTVLFEIVKESFFDEFIERLNGVCNPESIDYIVVNHTEPDHSGGLIKLLELCPKAKIVGTATAIKFVKEIVNIPFESIVVKEGDSISLGNKTLKFIMAPFLHWPDSMYTYIPEDKTIFTCDSFGCHYCDEKIFNDEIKEDFTDAYKYYYDCIISPFNSYMVDALNKIKDLDIETICCGHGPVIRKNVEKYIEMYRGWSAPVAKERTAVVIPYVTAYGYTEGLAKKISEGIKSAGDIDVHLFNLIDANTDEVLSQINLAKGVLLGSPTLIGDALPPILDLLNRLNPIIHKGLYAGAFGSYGWSGEAVGNIESRLKQLRFKMPVPGLKIVLNPSSDDLNKAFEFGKQFGEALLNI